MARTVERNCHEGAGLYLCLLFDIALTSISKHNAYSSQFLDFSVFQKEYKAIIGMKNKVLKKTMMTSLLEDFADWSDGNCWDQPSSKKHTVNS